MSEQALRLYGEIWGQPHDAFQERLKENSEARGFDELYESFARLGPGPHSMVLDVGCRDASGAIELWTRFGCRVVGVDPVPLHKKWAEEQIAEKHASGKVSFQPGRMEELPLADGSVDLIWSRDMISHVALSKGLAECCRVLRPGGSMLLYQAFATKLLPAAESAAMYRALAIRPKNMRQEFFEECAERAGLCVSNQEIIRSEWRESALQMEHGPKEIASSLLTVSRLVRQRDSLVKEFGVDLVDTTYWGELWSTYILIGKLCPVIYTLTKHTPAERT